MNQPASSNTTPIPLQQGALTAMQISLMLTHLPVDVTFVDADNVVRFYTEGAMRVFQRTPDVIGRSVLRCHPPASVHRVKRILDDFHAGIRDTAEFWIPMKGDSPEPRLIHIRYFSVRDSGGQFQGTIEVVQDVTAIRKLQGERRLLAEGE
ncbi:MAG: PAS domain-containing protein [Anaerolineales bacterium]